jgi:hypothetical protein
MLISVSPFGRDICRRTLIVSRRALFANPFQGGYNNTMIVRVKNAVRVNLLLLFTIGVLLTACSDEDGDDEPSPSTGSNLRPTDPPAPAAEAINERNGHIWSPRPGTSWQWQLTGEIDRSFDVQMYDIDLFDVAQSVIDELHSDGRIVICYFSGGSWEEWREDALDFPESIIGKPLQGWPGERWLDIRRIDLLGPLMQKRLDLAVAKGCDGVEPDNMTAYDNNSGFAISADDQIGFNIWMAKEAHARQLSIGLKNDLNQIVELVDHFDWALNEECFQYDECELLLPFIEAGKAVFGVEYEGDPDVYCPQANRMDFDWLTKDLDLDARRTSCR